VYCCMMVGVIATAAKSVRPFICQDLHDTADQESRSIDILMSLRTPLPESDYRTNLSSAHVLHASPSLPDLYSSSFYTPRLQRFRPSTPPMNTATLSSVDLQQHIYNSLLESRTADVALHVRGTWEAVYRLHRVVLIQSVRPAPVYYIPL